MTKMSSKIDAKINIGKISFRGRPSTNNGSELVARRGRRFGRKGRKEERNEDLKI